MSIEGSSRGSVTPAVVEDPDAQAVAVPIAAARELGGGFGFDSTEQTFSRYVGLFRKHQILIAAITAAFLLGGFIVTFMMTRIYTATTTIQIDREAAKVVRSQDDSGENTNDPQFYTTQYELLKSRAVAERVVNSLSLVENPDFTGQDTSLLARFSRLFSSSKGKSQPEIEQKRQAAILMISKGLTIQPVLNSRIVKINFSHRNPTIARDVSVAVAGSFVGMNLDRRFSASSYARSFLEEKLQQLKLKLEESERAVVAYAQKEGLVNVDDKLPQVGANLKMLNESMAAATAERIKNEQLWQQAQSANGYSLPQILNNPSIQKARERRTELMADYQDKLRVMKPDFPEMAQARAQIAEYDRQIKAQVDLIKQSIKAQYEASRDQEASFGQKMEKLKTEMLDLRNRSIQYNILQREVDTSRSLYDGLLQQYKEIGVTGAVGTNNVSIIDKAEVPRSPSSPILALNVAVALFLGLLVSAATVGIKEFIDDTFKVPEEIEEMLGLTVLGVIPLSASSGSKESMAKEVIADPLSASAEAYRSLRTALRFSTAAGTPKTLLVTSSQPSEGKSTTSVCLAANFAQLGMKVLLIDADLRKPSLHTVLATENIVGLSNVLTSTMDPGQVVHNNIINGVTFMASGPLPPNPAELLAGPKFGSLLTTARERFDIVIVDAPPVMGLADAPLLGSLVEATLLVIDSSNTRRRIVAAAVKRLYFARTNVIGALLNKFDQSKTGHSYGYGYGYGYGGEAEGDAAGARKAKLPAS